MFRLLKLGMLALITFILLTACAPSLMSTIVNGVQTGGFSLKSLTGGTSDAPTNDIDKAAYADLCPLFTAWKETNRESQDVLETLIADHATAVQTDDVATQAFLLAIRKATRGKAAAAESAAGLVLRECAARNR